MQKFSMKCDLRNWAPSSVSCSIHVERINGVDLLRDRDRYTSYLAMYMACQQVGLFQNYGKHAAFLAFARTDLFLASSAGVVISSAMRLDIGYDCHVEYVMTHPDFRRRGDRAGGRRGKSALSNLRGILLRLRSRWVARPADCQRAHRERHPLGSVESTLSAAASALLEYTWPP